MSADWSPSTLFTGLVGWITLLVAAPTAASALSEAATETPSFNRGPAEAAEPDEVLLWIHGKRVILSPGEELMDAALLVRDGIIIDLGAGLAAPEGARRIEGEVVCAGFIDAWSSLGLDPVSAGDFGTTASTRSVNGLDLYRRQDLRAEALAAGVTSARLQAGGSAPIGGMGAIVSTDAGVVSRVLLEDACVSATVGVSRGGNRPDVFDRVSEAGRLVGWLRKGEGYGRDQVEYRHELTEWQTTIAESREKLEKDFKKAKKDRDKDIEKAKEKGKEFKEEKYKEDKKPKKPRFDADDEVLARVAEGELPLVVEAHRAPELRALLEKTAELERMRWILAGASDAAHFAEELAERDIPVLLQVDPASLGLGDYEDFDLSLAGALEAQGVEVLIGSGGTNTARDLRLLAALAVGYGLDREAALHAITLGPARAFDVADQVGSLARGKVADIVILDGDPLDSQARVQQVVARGRVAGQ